MKHAAFNHIAPQGYFSKGQIDYLVKDPAFEETREALAECLDQMDLLTYAAEAEDGPDAEKIKAVAYKIEYAALRVDQTLTLFDQLHRENVGVAQWYAAKLEDKIDRPVLEDFRYSVHVTGKQSMDSPVYFAKDSYSSLPARPDSAELEVHSLGDESFLKQSSLAKNLEEMQSLRDMPKLLDSMDSIALRNSLTTVLDFFTKEENRAIFDPQQGRDFS